MSRAVLPAAIMLLVLTAKGDMTAAHGGSHSSTVAHARKGLLQHHATAHASAPAPGTVPAPNQGFEGNDVSHVDMETATGDWQREYGPKGPAHHPAASLKSGAFGAIPCMTATALLAAAFQIF